MFSAGWTCIDHDVAILWSWMVLYWKICMAKDDISKICLDCHWAILEGCQQVWQTKTAEPQTMPSIKYNQIVSNSIIEIYMRAHIIVHTYVHQTLCNMFIHVQYLIECTYIALHYITSMRASPRIRLCNSNQLWRVRRPAETRLAATKCQCYRAIDHSIQVYPCL